MTNEKYNEFTYNQLLNTPEWKRKRNLILYYERNTCQRCGSTLTRSFDTYSYRIETNIDLKFEKVLSNHIRIVSFKYKDFEVYCKTFYNIENYAEELCIKFNLIEKGKTSNLNDFTTLNAITSYFDDNKGTINVQFINFLKLEYKDTIDFEKFDIDLDGFYLDSDKNNFFEFKNRNLNVHHKCYKEGLEIWAQPNSDYITLCNICHNIIHENITIPFYHKNNEGYSLLTHCERCDGKGYIKEYNHVQNGICFACYGSGVIFDKDTQIYSIFHHLIKK